jgi:hypothetical protein
MHTIFLSPSDFAFLYLESKWGFYQKYKQGIKRPPIIIPKIFTKIDHLIKSKYLNQSFNTICKTLPTGVLTEADQWVKSKAITNPDFPDVEILFRGKIDGVLKNEDGTYTVIDFKTSEISENYLTNYINQLSCYAYCLRHPNSQRDFSLNVNDKLGLFVFEPKEFMVDYNSKAGIKGDLQYIEYDFNEVEFENFVKNEVIPFLMGPEPKPEDSDPCWYYLKQFGFEYEQE